jgi:hypothetical protein
MRQWSPTARVVTFVLGLVAAVVLFIAGAVYLTVRSFTESPDACDTVDGVAPQALTWAAEDGQWYRSTAFEVSADRPRMRVDSVVVGEENAPIFPVGVRIFAVKAGTALEELRPRPSTSGSPPSSAPPRTDIVSIGSGIHGVNEEEVLGEGRWELVSDGPASQTTVRPCG